MICAKCGAEHLRRHRYCTTCFAAYMREWRKTAKPLSPLSLFKARARNKAGVYKRRGDPALQQLSCEVCGDENSQMHHPDYTKPLAVVWLCRGCHLGLHPTKLSHV